MKKFTTIKDLQNEAINLSQPILVWWPQHEKEEILEPYVTSSLDYQYNIHNSVIAFVYDGIMYVIPYMLPVINILEQHGFKQGYMDVPFSKGDYPLFEKAQWFALQHMAYEQKLIDLEDSCIKYCEKHGIMPICDSLLKKCLEIPRDGLHVTHTFFSNIYYPAIEKPYFNTFVMHILGLYSINNHICVFIYRNGHTYVTPSVEVVKCLQQSGYLETSMFVPLARGEKIVDPKYAKLWEQICSEK